MNGKKTIRHLIFGTLVFLLFLTGRDAYAEGYRTTDFHVNVKVNRDRSYDFTEEITVDFSAPRHGIYRDIPYELGETIIKDIQVVGHPFKVKHQHEDGRSVARIIIGDEDRTLTGDWTYHIRYRIVPTRREEEGGDEIYLNLFPYRWETPIESASCMLTMPSEIDWEKVDFYSGRYGSNGLSDKFRHTAGKDFLTVEGKNLAPGETFTMLGILPDGFWQGAFDRHGRDGFYFAGIGLIAALIALLWFLFGRDPRVVPSVEVTPPKGITPLDAGYLIDGEVSENDMLSLIPYFAQKKYLRIDRNEIGGTILQRLVPADGLSESQGEVEVFRGLFPDGIDRLDTTDTNSSKIFMIARLRKQHFDLAEKFVKAKHDGEDMMYTRASKIARWIGFGLIGLMFLSVFLYVSWVAGGFPDRIWFLVPLLPLLGTHLLVEAVERRLSRTWWNQLLFIGVAIGIFALTYVAIRNFLTLFHSTTLLPGIGMAFAAALFFEVNMLARTRYSSDIVGKLLGFKEFIRVAELDRIQMLVHEDPNYFFDVLPYAYVFGLTDVWTGHFEALKLDQPEWYRDRTKPFFDFADVTRSVDAISASFASVDADMGSDSDGFSGGGDGGGGGGAW